jgi:hypothetical protein
MGSTCLFCWYKKGHLPIWFQFNHAGRGGKGSMLFPFIRLLMAWDRIHPPFLGGSILAMDSRMNWLLLVQILVLLINCPFYAWISSINIPRHPWFSYLPYARYPDYESSSCFVPFCAGIHSEIEIPLFSKDPMLFFLVLMLVGYIICPL